ncbi:MAG TPA: hypothetical protein VFC79_07105, partial [Tissierellaceae bacterium]|nr:hypothetical protein [Tissierellaceae bacterium]
CMNYILPNSGVQFIEDSHQYWLGDKQLNGITGILSRHLFPDKYDNIPSYILENAANRGTIVHDACRDWDMVGEYYISDADREDDKIVEFIESYIRISEQYNLKPVYSEYLVTDGTDYASAIDSVFEIEKLLALGDIKTTYKLDKEYLSWQLSIYKYLFEKQTGLKVDKLFAIWVRDGGHLIEVQYKGDDKIKALLDADREGRLYKEDEAASTELSKIDNALSNLKGVMVEIDRLKELESEYKAQMEALFETYNVESWDTEDFKITRVKETKVESFDSKLFLEENPEMYKNYKKESVRKGYIKTTKRWK